MLRSALRTAKSLRATRHTLRCASTLAGVLQENAAELPWREIVKDSKAGVKWSYSDLNEQTIAFANGLGELGLNVGDTIVTILPNNAENLVTTLAAGSIGVNVVPTTASTAGQLESVLATSGAKAVVFSKEAEDTIAKLLPDVVEQDFVVQDYESINDARFPELDAVITTDWELTDNQVVNFRTLFMYNNGNRCYVERAAANIDETVPLVGGATHKDILSAGGANCMGFSFCVLLRHSCVAFPKKHPLIWYVFCIINRPCRRQTGRHRQRSSGTRFVQTRGHCCRCCSSYARPCSPSHWGCSS